MFKFAGATEVYLPADVCLQEINGLRTKAASILRQNISGLQVIPPVAVKLLKLTNDEASSFSDLALIIETEPSLTLEILRLVNSAYYNYPHKIVSIKRAVTLLGFSAVRQIALNLLFFKKMIKSKGKPRFNQIFFWQHCLFVATLSKVIAEEVGHPDPDMLYSAGLLHDIGKVVFESYGQLSYSDLIQTFENSSASVRDSEQSFFGINHAQMGGLFCHNCDLPETIVQIVLGHHRGFANFNSQVRQNIAIVAYADFIAWMQGIGSIDEQDYPLLQPEVFTLINNLNIDIETVLEKVDQEIRDVSSFYQFKFPSLSQLRANLLGTIFKLDLTDSRVQIKPAGTDKRLNSLTAPHRSLNPDEFIPWTLEAIHNEFDCERVLLLDIDPQRRSLISAYHWPEKSPLNAFKAFEISISALSERLLDCLRNKKAVLINGQLSDEKALLEQLHVSAFFCLPVIINHRLSSVLYIDNPVSDKPVTDNDLDSLNNVAAELGIALSNARQFQLEKNKAQQDPLTGLPNKRVIQEQLADVFLSQPHKLSNLAIGFIDIDYFKQFNDSYGHQAGDDVLRIVADILTGLTRPNDFIARYGGEEFLFVLYDTNKKGALSFAQRIRAEIEKKGQVLKNRFPEQSLTASIGVVMYHTKYQDYLTMIDAADAAMYQAKAEGRNQVVIHTNKEAV